MNDSISPPEVNRPKRTTRRSKAKTKEMLWAYAFIAPVVIGLAIFYMAPAIASFYLSLTDWDGLTAPTFIGFDNFVNLMSDGTFLRALGNTAVYTFVSVPISIALATLVAVLLNQKIKGIVVYRTLYFLPVVTMPIAVGMVWKWLYNSEFGLINYVLGLLNLPQPGWMFDERFALLSIIFVAVWMTVGYNAVLLLAGLQGISSTYYEAATLDGASGWRQFLHITLPLLSPSLFFVTVISLIGSLQVFDLVFIMIGDNYALLEPTRTAVYSIWESGFKNFEMGYAAAQALVLFVVILILTIIQFYYQKKWVHYE